MKKILCVLLALLLVCSITACGAQPKEPENDPKEDAILEAVGYATLYTHRVYEIKGCLAKVTNCEVDGNIYTLYGKTLITDKYGDKWVAKFEFEYEYDESTKKFDLMDDYFSEPVREDW